MQIAEAAVAAVDTTPDLAEPERWLASRRRARARRFAAARVAARRRFGNRSVAIAAGVVALGACAAGGAAAQQSAAPAKPTSASALLRRGSSGDAVAGLQRALGIGADGMFGPQTARAVRAFQAAHGLEVDGIAGPATLGALGVKPAAAPPMLRASIGMQPDPTLARIARCESGGNPAAISADGRYRGKYQFSRATWRRLGGTGDPARAPEAEQDRIAALLLAREGTTPWPVCAAHV